MVCFSFFILQYPSVSSDTEKAQTPNCIFANQNLRFGIAVKHIGTPIPIVSLYADTMRQYVSFRGCPLFYFDFDLNAEKLRSFRFVKRKASINATLYVPSTKNRSVYSLCVESSAKLQQTFQIRKRSIKKSVCIEFFAIDVYMKGCANMLTPQ